MSRRSTRLRERKDHSLAVRIIAAIGGIILALVSLPLVIIIPELAIPGLLVALRLLGFQFVWARRANIWLDDRYDKLKGWLSQRLGKNSKRGR